MDNKQNTNKCIGKIKPGDQVAIYINNRGKVSSKVEQITKIVDVIGVIEDTDEEFGIQILLGTKENLYGFGIIENYIYRNYKFVNSIKEYAYAWIAYPYDAKIAKIFRSKI